MEVFTIYKFKNRENHNNFENINYLQLKIILRQWLNQLWSRKIKIKTYSENPLS